jgi:hypothetical protein
MHIALQCSAITGTHHPHVENQHFHCLPQFENINFTTVESPQNLVETKKAFIFPNLHDGIGFHIQVVAIKYVGGSGLTCPQCHDQKSKLIGIYPWTIKD